MQTNVGIMEVSGFNRYEIVGTGVHDWLDTIMCSRVPRKPGKVGLAYFLNHDGNVKGEATLTNLDGDRVWCGSAAAAEYHDRDWFEQHIPPDSDIRIESLTDSHTILVIAGPKSRDVLQAACPGTDWSASAFPWLTCQTVSIGGTDVVAMAVSFSGELAWELHVPNAQLKPAFETLWAAGEPYGLRPFGLNATESMRLEKGYRHWKADLITEFNPLESDLSRFVDMTKDFVGKKPLQDMQRRGPRRQFVSLTIDNPDIPAHPGDSILQDGEVVGTVTSAGWGHRVGQNIVMGFVDPVALANGAELQIMHVGTASDARIGEMCRYDPENSLVET